MNCCIRYKFALSCKGSHPKKIGYSKFEVESSAFLNEKKNLISNFEVENCYNPILRNFALWLKTANVIASWNLLNTCIDTE